MTIEYVLDELSLEQVSDMDDTVDLPMPWGRRSDTGSYDGGVIYRLPVQDRSEQEDRRPYAPSPLPPGMDPFERQRREEYDRSDRRQEPKVERGVFIIDMMPYSS